ncbi:helix-turn-helix transcriptional regulator [Streptomyces sp. ME19-01-6]|uniref:helix-turn-helix domain-containing protein n=1 Tax=Streptomyces sp. ME19-01-6 TaxID=3028686 RepID=UPI0029AEA639|nr:helix-turn-helix transcriptional regulator [Streptomyces sp. ME19-01-6]MDX3227210.1 helix-turn-helix transcriptional regulator [Streptomyces sp. ME19-01-6]
MDRVRRDSREVVAGLLGDDRFLAACARRDMGALFRLLNNRGISTRRIAAAVDITQGRLYDYMNGKSRVEKLVIFEQIADAFHIPGQLLGLASRPWEPTPAPPPALERAVPPDGDDLAAVDAFRSADRQTGGGRLYGAVVRHLSGSVAPRLVDADSSPHVFAAAAALTEMAGWMAHDSGRDDLAGRHFTRALSLARTSGDTLLAANIAASNSHLALQAGDPTSASHWARTGLELAGQGPRVPALTARLHVMSARALAASTQAAVVARALDQAHQALDSATPQAEHLWLSPFDSAALASEAALALRDLGQYDDALHHAEQAIALRETGRARSLAFSRITLCRIHIDRQDLDAAVSVGHTLIAADPALSSVRVVHQLDTVRKLLASHRDHRPVRDLLARFDEAWHARMLLLADIIQPPSKGTTP